VPRPVSVLTRYLRKGTSLNQADCSFSVVPVVVPVLAVPVLTHIKAFASYQVRGALAYWTGCLP
jgi:hypothetical protein